VGLAQKRTAGPPDQHPHGKREKGRFDSSSGVPTSGASNPLGHASLAINALALDSCSRESPILTEPCSVLRVAESLSC